MTPQGIKKFTGWQTKNSAEALLVQWKNESAGEGVIQIGEKKLFGKNTTYRAIMVDTCRILL